MSRYMGMQDDPISVARHHHIDTGQLRRELSA